MKWILLAEQCRQESFMVTRQAQLHDVASIYQLIASLTQDGTLLPRSTADISQDIDTFTVVETEDHEFAGCAALHVYGQHLAEVRSIVVRPEIKGHGAGSLLVDALLHRAEAGGIRCVCLFTRIPDFFAHFQFHKAEHAALRDKVLKDCLQCPRRHACDEVAMALGDLPAQENYGSEGLPAWLTGHPNGKPQTSALVQLHA